MFTVRLVHFWADRADRTLYLLFDSSLSVWNKQRAGREDQRTFRSVPQGQFSPSRVHDEDNQSESSHGGCVPTVRADLWLITTLPAQSRDYRLFYRRRPWGLWRTVLQSPGACLQLLYSSCRRRTCPDGLRQNGLHLDSNAPISDHLLCHCTCRAGPGQSYWLLSTSDSSTPQALGRTARA